MGEFFNLYAVRDIQDKQGVGFFWVPNVEALIDAVDEVHDPGVCEYCEVTEAGAFIWEDHVPPIGVERHIDRPKDLSEYNALVRGIRPIEAIERFFDAADHEWEPLFPGVVTGRKVYFIECDGHVKIGTTRGPIEKRVRALATAHHRPLTVIGWIDNAADDLETSLHQRFAQHRVRGEWFVLAQEILDFIGPYRRA